MNWLARIDAIVLFVLFAYICLIAIRVSYRFHIARPFQGMDGANRRKLIAEADIELGKLKSIACAAPYLGLVGTCCGILSAFRGYAMEKHAALVMITSTVAASLVTAAGGIVVAVPATCFYNYFRTRLNLLEGPARRHGFRLTRRISEFPAFTLIAAPSIAIPVLFFTTFASFYPPLGFEVRVPSKGCGSKTGDGVIMLHVDNGGKLFVNDQHQDMKKLERRMSEVHGAHSYRTICLSADENVPFQAVADVVDMLKGSAMVGDVSLAKHP
jgi:biopolymer transport protein ExbD